MERLQSNKGIALIELLIAIAISSIIIGLAIQVMVLVRSTFLSSNIRYTSRDLLDSTVDILRSIKESDWDILTLDGVYHPVVSGEQWTLSPGDEQVAGTQFNRSIEITGVCRDESLATVTCPAGTNDPDSRMASVIISWSSPIPGSITNSLLLTRYAGNGFWNQSTSADFNSGEKKNILLTTVDDGELTLESNSGPGWSSSSRVGNINITNSQNVNSHYVYDGKLFLVKDNDPGGQELLIYSLSNPASPSLISATELGSNGKKIIVHNGYAYVATSDDSQELKIFNISDPTFPLPLGNLNLPGSTDATNLALSGSRLYLVRALDATEAELYSINISNPAVPSLVYSQNFSDTVSDIVIDGKYAYLSTHIDNAEVIAIDLTANYPTDNNITDEFDITGNENTRAISFLYPNIYVSSNQNKIYILNAQNPQSISELTQFSLSNIGDIYIADNKAFFVDLTSGTGLYIYDISTPSSPSSIGNHAVGANAFAVFVNGSYAYVLNQSNSRELIVVNGGGTNNVTYGEFISQTFDTGNGLTTIQSVSWNADLPANTQIAFQIGVNSLGYAFEYVGPDGTPGTYFTSTGSYPLSASDGQYIRVKAILTGDGTSTPTVEDIRLTYIQ